MPPQDGRDIVIVGGGLVGSLLASVLACRGHRVTVYERRSDPRSGPRGGGRSINLVLTRRGIRALERVGLARGALSLSVPVTGRMMHGDDGSTVYQPYGRDPVECNHSVSRGELNRYLIDRAERRGAAFRFGMRLIGADLGTGDLAFHDEPADREIGARADVVFGADGAGSALREGFEALAGFRSSTEAIDHGYKELTIPASGDGSPHLDIHALHIWPRGESMLMALPNTDNSFTATLYLRLVGTESFASIETRQAAVALFEERFGDALPLLPSLADEFFDNPTGTLGTVRCGPWHAGGRALLLGDAAHAIVPFFGQGMNTGFEDCRVLDDLLASARGDDWETVFAALFRLRKPAADAIADMALENFIEMRARVADPRFLLRKGVEHRLETAFPLEYRSRYSLVMYSHVPFHLAKEAGRIQERILEELCTGLERAEDLDLDRALARIRRTLSPFFAANGISLDY